jgi:Aspartyl protease/Domain of unknown function (DUF4124)
MRMVNVLAAVGVLLGAIPAGAELYRWTDANGVVRYTNELDLIPPAYRAGAKDVGSPQGRPPVSGAAVESAVIPFKPGEAIRAAARVNGVSLTLMVDTGADRTVISPAALGRAGLATDGGRLVHIMGVTGGAAAREVVVQRLDLAGVQVGPLAIIAHDVGVGGVDGLLGRDVLDRFTLTVDSANGQAILAPR